MPLLQNIYISILCMLTISSITLGMNTQGDAIFLKTEQHGAANIMKNRHNLEKKLIQATRPSNIRFLLKNYDQIKKLKNSYNPHTDEAAVDEMWNQFLSEELEPMMKATKPIFKKMFNNNEASAEIAMAAFKVQLKKGSNLLKEQFIVSTEVEKMRDRNR